MSESNTSSYNCWDEWDEVDYDDHWEEYDDYTEYSEYDDYKEWDEHDDYGECYGYGVYADCGAQDQDYGEVDCPAGDTTYKETSPPGGGTGGGDSENKSYKILDIINAKYSKDGIIFEYLLYDKKNKTMIASTLHEELFVNVAIKGSLDLSSGDYCVSSVGDISFEEITRINDYLKKRYITASDQDIYYDKNYKGTMIFARGVSIYIQPNQVVCEGTAYAVNPDEKYIYPFFKVKDVINDKIGGIADIYYESSTDLTIVKATKGTVYHVTVFNAEFYRDERYVRYEGDVEIDKLQLAKQAVSEKFNVPYVDIVCDNNKITYIDNGGISYEILSDDIGGYYYYEYDYYIPANAVLTSKVYIPTQPAIPNDYYRVVKQIQQMTGLPENAITQDDNGITYVYGVPVYVPGAVKFGGQVYAKHEDVVSALRSAFVDIQDYLHSKGFYHGKDDNGSDYDSVVYDAGYKKILLLKVGLDIDKRIRINNGNKSYNLAVNSSYIEHAVQSAFGTSASELGRRAISDNIIKTYFYNELYISKIRVAALSNALYVNGSSYSLSNYQTSFNKHTYMDKIKLLSLVRGFVPSISIASINPDPLNDTNYTLFENKTALITLNSAHLDHAAVQVISPNGTETWYEKYFTSYSNNTLSVKVQLKEAGTYKLKVRGRTTIDPNTVNATIPHSKDCEINITTTVYPTLSEGLVYLEPYARFTGCTVSKISNYIKVSYQHEHYSSPETVTYYKSLNGQAAYRRKCSYNSYGMYLNRNDFRMDMDFDIVTDNNKNRDWYLEKRIWRLWINRKIASFSEIKYDSEGHAYYDINMNGNIKKVYKDPELNQFDIKLLEANAASPQINTISLQSDSRQTIRNVNNHLVMPQDKMFALFDYSVKLRDYIELHYLMLNPSQNLTGNGTDILLFGNALDIDCMFNNDGYNYSSEDKINAGMNKYFDDYLVNIYDNLPPALQNAFSYEISETSSLGTLSFGGFNVELPASIITKSTNDINPSNYNNPTEYAKVALYAKVEDVSKMNKYRRIVVYGGGYGGICAAYKAAQYSNSLGGDLHFEVVLINPAPVPKLGGIGTVGGQNFWDTRTHNKKFPYRGSLDKVMSWDSSKGSIVEDRYNTDKKAEALERLLRDENVTIYKQHDIVDITQDLNGNIKSITVKGIKRQSNGVVDYFGSSTKIYGDVFIDASEDGKLTMISAHDLNGNPAYTRGRYDYPTGTLTPSEGAWNMAKQPASTIMFKLKCNEIIPTEAGADKRDDLFNCGNESFDSAESKMFQFNEKIKNLRFMIKPVNSAWNGGVKDGGKTEWWINSIMIFDVDGTLHNRDSSDYTPLSAAEIADELDCNTPYSGKVLSTDDAWLLGRAFIKKYEDELIGVYKGLGYEDAEFVKDANGDVVTGEILYIRETIHTVKDTDLIANGTENENYEVTMRHCHYSYFDDEQDNQADPHSIGLIYYLSDIHPFIKDNCKNDNGYIWGWKSYKHIRRDIEDLDENSPIEPAFIPYEALTTQYVPNLLIPGYAVNASSFAWSEIRVFPNLCVLGDAAGIAAVTSLLSGYSPKDLKDIAGVRTILKRYNAILDRSELGL